MQTGFAPVGPRRTFEGAVEQIAEQIHLGELSTGDRLPSERELAAAMQISRATLREAARVLAEAGVLVVRPGASGGRTRDMGDNGGCRARAGGRGGGCAARRPRRGD